MTHYRVRMPCRDLSFLMLLNFATFFFGAAYVGFKIEELRHDLHTERDATAGAKEK